MFSETTGRQKLSSRQAVYDRSGWKTVFPQLMEGTVEMKLQLAK